MALSCLRTQNCGNDRGKDKSAAGWGLAVHTQGRDQGVNWSLDRGSGMKRCRRLRKDSRSSAGLIVWPQCQRRISQDALGHTAGTI